MSNADGLPFIVALWYCDRNQLTGFKINRHRNMLKCDQPLSIDFTIAIGDKYGPVYRVPLNIGTPDMLEAVTKPGIAFNGNTEICDRELE